MTVLAIVASVLACTRPPARLDVLVDHDGDIDDLMAIALLLRSPDVRVDAITVCPGVSFLEPATRATQLLVDRLGGAGIVVGQGHSAGTNPFPDQWRKDSSRVLGIPALAGTPNGVSVPVAAEDAPHLLARMLSGKRYVILETGPMTNVSAALKLDPTIAKNISRIYAMGGAVRVKGNVDQPGHDGSAEWNVFNSPDATDDVVKAGIPLTLVPLDATNQVPLTRAFLAQLRTQSSVASQLAAQAWGLVETPNEDDQFYFWDTLTAVAMLDPQVVTTEKLTIRVMTTGESQGRTIEDPNGVAVDVALRADRQRLERTLLDILGR